MVIERVAAINKRHSMALSAISNQPRVYDSLDFVFIEPKDIPDDWEAEKLYDRIRAEQRQGNDNALSRIRLYRDIRKKLELPSDREFFKELAGTVKEVLSKAPRSSGRDDNLFAKALQKFEIKLNDKYLDECNYERAGQVIEYEMRKLKKKNQNPNWHGLYLKDMDPRFFLPKIYEQMRNHPSKLFVDGLHGTIHILLFLFFFSTHFFL